MGTGTVFRGRKTEPVPAYFLRFAAFAFFLRGARLAAQRGDFDLDLHARVREPTTIMVAAGRTSPNALPMAGQQRSKSAASVMR